MILSKDFDLSKKSDSSLLPEGAFLADPEQQRELEKQQEKRGIASKSTKYIDDSDRYPDQARYTFNGAPNWWNPNGERIIDVFGDKVRLNFWDELLDISRLTPVKPGEEYQKPGFVKTIYQVGDTVRYCGDHPGIKELTESKVLTVEGFPSYDRVQIKYQKKASGRKRKDEVLIFDCYVHELQKIGSRLLKSDFQKQMFVS